MIDRMLGRTASLGIAIRSGLVQFYTGNAWQHLEAKIEVHDWAAAGKLRHASYTGLRERQDNADVFRLD